MNVLVLNGPGVSPAALRHTLASLRALLFPYYAVQTVSPDVLASNAWVHTCALLVFTGGRDMLYLSSLANSNANIINYVRHGGSFLGFCAGAYYASDSIEWELGRDSYEVKGTRPLKFFPGISRGCVYPGFAYDSDDGARIVKLTRPDGKAYDGLYYNGGGEFVDAEKHPGVTVAANYDTDSGADKAAGVVCKVGHGKASLWGVHLEYSLLLEPLRGMLQGVSHDTALQWEKERTALLQDELQSLGLRIPERSRSIYAHPLPQYLIASPHLVGLVNSTVAKLSPNHSAQSSWVLKDTHDTFHFHGGTAGFGSSAMRSQPNENAIEPELDGPKHIIFYDRGLPSPSETPLFSLPLFFSSLQEARSRRYLTKTTCDQWGVGELLLYGEAVTSTHSLVEQNPLLMNGFAVPLVSLASHQLSGRGRGANVWLSPPGQLMFSVLFRASYSKPDGPLPYLPAARLVYVQYLVGIAIVRACQFYLGADGSKVKLKWPNDIYAVLHQDGAIKKLKLGGILISSTFQDGNVSVLIGCGLNVFNEQPTTSLCAISTSTTPELKMESLAADILSRIELLWKQFLAVRGNFDSFMSEYLDCWMHSDEIVTIATVQPPVKAKIVGITPDYGLLRTIPLNSPQRLGSNFVDLQPDGNSFDMMAGMIKAKT